MEFSNTREEVAYSIGSNDFEIEEDTNDFLDVRIHITDNIFGMMNYRRFSYGVEISRNADYKTIRFNRIQPIIDPNTDTL